MTDRTQLLADLDALDALFSGPEKWTKGTWARDADGQGVWSGDPTAICWCLSGAINKIGCGRPQAAANLREVIEGNGYITAINDDDAFAFDDLKRLISDARERVAGETA